MASRKRRLQTSCPWLAVRQPLWEFVVWIPIAAKGRAFCLLPLLGKGAVGQLQEGAGNQTLVPGIALLPEAWDSSRMQG